MGKIVYAPQRNFMLQYCEWPPSQIGSKVEQHPPGPGLNMKPSCSEATGLITAARCRPHDRTTC